MYACPSLNLFMDRYSGRLLAGIFRKLIIYHFWTYLHIYDKQKLHFHITMFPSVSQRRIYIEGILPKGPYPPCLRMADRVLLAGYPR